MTISEWLSLCPTTEEVQSDDFHERTEEEQEAHKALILGLFDGVEKMKLATLITDGVGALYTVEPRYAVTICEHLFETLKKDYVLSSFPPAIKALLDIIMDDE